MGSKTKNFVKDENTRIKKFTVQQAKDSCIKFVNDFYNGRTTDISDWEFDSLMKMLETIDNEFNPYESLEIDKQINESGKLTIDKENCPYCKAELLRVDNYKICNNEKCSYWLNKIIKALSKCLEQNNKLLFKKLSYQDINAIKLIINRDTLKELLLNDQFIKYMKLGKNKEYDNVINTHISYFERLINE